MWVVQGNFAETLRQTLAGLLTDAEMAAAGLLLDQGPASSFQGGPTNKASSSSSSSSSSSPKTEAGSPDATGSMSQGEHRQAAHHEGRDPGSDNNGRASLASDLSLQSQQQQQHEHAERQPQRAGVHHQQHAMEREEASSGQHAQPLQHEYSAELQARLARISSNWLASRAQRRDHLAAPEEPVPEQSASPAMAEVGAGDDSIGTGSPSGSMLDHEDDDWLDEPHGPPSEEDLQFEAEAIADMVREANLTALAQQLQGLYDDHEWAEEYD